MNKNFYTNLFLNLKHESLSLMISMMLILPYSYSFGGENEISWREGDTLHRYKVTSIKIGFNHTIPEVEEGSAASENQLKSLKANPSPRNLKIIRTLPSGLTFYRPHASQESAKSVHDIATPNTSPLLLPVELKLTEEEIVEELKNEDTNLDYTGLPGGLVVIIPQENHDEIYKKVQETVKLKEENKMVLRNRTVYTLSTPPGSISLQLSQELKKIPGVLDAFPVLMRKIGIR